MSAPKLHPEIEWEALAVHGDAGTFELLIREVATGEMGVVDITFEQYEWSKKALDISETSGKPTYVMLGNAQVIRLGGKDDGPPEEEALPG